jgi:hypothetical protein
MDGNIIIKATVANMESLKDSSVGMTYGVLEKESEINCKVHTKAIRALKI